MKYNEKEYKEIEENLIYLKQVKKNGNSGAVYLPKCLIGLIVEVIVPLKRVWALKNAEEKKSKDKKEEETPETPNIEIPEVNKTRETAGTTPEGTAIHYNVNVEQKEGSAIADNPKNLEIGDI